MSASDCLHAKWPVLNETLAIYALQPESQSKRNGRTWIFSIGRRLARTASELLSEIRCTRPQLAPLMGSFHIVWQLAGMSFESCVPAVNGFIFRLCACFSYLCHCFLCTMRWSVARLYYRPFALCRIEAELRSLTLLRRLNAFGKSIFRTFYSVYRWHANSWIGFAESLHVTAIIFL